MVVGILHGLRAQNLVLSYTRINRYEETGGEVWLLLYSPRDKEGVSVRIVVGISHGADDNECAE